MAATHNIPASRVDEVIEMTGLATVAGKRVGGFSLGMGQRLGIASAMLGDPRTLILDEPVNGLDPEGVQWVRQLVRALPHTTPSGLRELWAPCGHGTRCSRSKIKRHAVDLGIHRWGGWGSTPRPRDYESHALTS